MHSNAALPSIHSLLVVDDSVVQRDHAVKLGRELGIANIYEAADGAEALQLLGLLPLPPDLILIDLEMPVMDGVQLLEALHERGIQVPIVVASSRESALLDSVHTLAQTLGLRILSALRKPVTAQALREALQHWGGSVCAARKRASQPVIEPGRLAQAIAQGELSVHYQPKVDMRTGLLRGVEALARWTHPELGPVGPDQFIPMAEGSGLIHGLTMAVAEQALAQAARWNARSAHFSLALNLSPLLLDRADLVGELESLVLRHGLRTDQVVLELTESSVASGVGVALARLARLRLRGFGLSIDDFGTGFSSMLQLARVPFTELKIDRSFVHGAAQRKHLRLMLESALDMARRLDLVSVGEGIETVEDWRLLQQLGCNLGQGWLVARAMPAAELDTWRKTHIARLPALRAEAAAEPY